MLAMMRYFDIEYVREHLEDLIEEVSAGNPFIITVKGFPRAQVVPANPEPEEAQEGQGESSQVFGQEAKS
ncbi:MAG TPA: type II toxin-antitoxin system prevent-host-death family antitoxin [Terracidiphilus sp.]|jgi:prevent-host-death family protein|nr:type II toxin-antitoxin system prevent-host-death family antitoxin [Terracidiphilus sp.]